MKINIIIPSTVLGGGLRVIFIYANYWTKQGHDVCVYLPGIYKWKDTKRVNWKTSIANSFIRRNKLSWFENQFQIKVVPTINDKFIRDADIVLATAWFTASNVYHLSAKKGKKVYFVQDYEIWNQDKKIVDNTYKLEMTRVVITKTLRDTLYRECGVDSYVVYNGHNSEEYIVVKKNINHPKTVIMLGNFAEYKGGEMGLRILKRMHEKYGIRVIIFGVHEYDGLPEYVEFYKQPERKKLISLFQQSDICLFPSKREAWGLTAIEAMANKAAVVGFSTGCLKEIGKNEDNALVIEEIDEIQLEKALERLIVDEHLLVKLQNNGYERVQGLTWEKSGQAFEDILLQLLEEE